MEILINKDDGFQTVNRVDEKRDLGDENKLLSTIGK
jgi:hypothetical protein